VIGNDPLDDLHAELAEIDENLIRSQLSPAQTADAIARRKAIYLEIHPETKRGAAGLAAVRGDQNDNLSVRPFTENTAAATGKDRRTVERAAARGEKLGDSLKDIAGTSLDSGVELDALAKKTPEERAELVERAKGFRSRSREFGKSQRRSRNRDRTSQLVVTDCYGDIVGEPFRRLRRCRVSVSFDFVRRFRSRTVIVFSSGYFCGARASRTGQDEFEKGGISGHAFDRRGGHVRRIYFHQGNRATQRTGGVQRDQNGRFSRF
jgi:hypothetical protein